MKQIFFLVCMVLLSGISINAQTSENSGSLKGIVKDNNEQPVSFAQVSVFMDTVFVMGTVADIDGNYTLKNITAGKYNVLGRSVGYKDVKIMGVDIQAFKTVFVDIRFDSNPILLESFVYIEPRISKDQTVQSQTFNRQDILKLPSRDASSAAKITGGANGRNGNLSLRGSRGDALVFIDGVKVRGGAGIPQQAVQEVQVIIGGTPADIGYSERGGGIISMESVPPSTPKVSPYHAPPQYYPEPNTNEYADFEDNDFLSSSLEPLSTFSVDVDKASYSLVRNYIKGGMEPPRGAVRLEEMVNYFDYNYPNPSDGHPFNIITELTECPWNKDSKILKLALQGKRIPANELPPSVFTFLIDVSGSMQDPSKLPLVKASLLKLLESMRPQDKVGIVVYAGSAGVVLEPSTAGKKSIIINKIMAMEAGGSTAGGQGIQLAYKLAEEHLVKDGNNRIILCTDGDFNVGISSESELGDLIETERKKGIFLTVLGYGMGNYKDSRLEILADKGNGNYAYIDDYGEAEKFLGKEFAGSMYTIAKDVKIQMEFNPELVKSYRLIGYENRVLAAQDFNDDKKDAGEIGAGHTVTALYEIRADEKFCKKVDSLKYQKSNMSQIASNEIGTVKFRYKKPDGNESILITKTLNDKSSTFQQADESTRFAISVAAFGMTLRKSEYIKDLSMNGIIDMASASGSYDEEGHRADFISMMKSYKRVGGIVKQ